MDGSLEGFEEVENKAFADFVEDFRNENVDWVSHKYPIEFKSNQFFELELNALERIAFAVADNPFFRGDVAKYYPECHIINQETGTILATINPFTKSDARFPGISFMDNFRDDKLKINDDRKIRMDLESLRGPSIMIVCTVKTYDLRKEKAIKEGMFDNAWFRLQNEDTNQSLDYEYVKKVDLPEGFVEETGAVDGEAEEEEADQAERNELTYICGRVWLNDEPKTQDEKVKKMKQEKSQKSIAEGGEEGENASGKGTDHNKSKDVQSNAEELAKNGKWVYERFNMVTTSTAFPNLVQDMANLSKRVRDEEANQFFAMEEAEAFVKKQVEDRKLAEMLQAAKKKKPTKKGAKEVEPEVPPPEKEKKEEVKDEGPPDYNNNKDFLRCLRKTAPRAFTFGPIKFSDLNIDDTPAI